MLNNQNPFDGMKDDLPWLKHAPQEDEPQKFEPEQPGRTIHEEVCPRCNGTGRVRFYREGGRCFKCNGIGKLTFKSSPEQRQRNRELARARKAKRAAEKAQEAVTWCDQHKAERDWLNAAEQRGFNFAVSLKQYLVKHGELTAGQLKAVHRCMAAEADREAKREAARKANAARAADIDIARIEAAFATAKEKATAKGRKIKLALRIRDFKFTPAPANGKNPGAVYVKNTETDQYMGKCFQGTFYPVRECTDEQRDSIIEIASDPEKHARLHGQHYKNCSVCGRELTNEQSMNRGIGPICAQFFGWAA